MNAPQPAQRPDTMRLPERILALSTRRPVRALAVARRALESREAREPLVRARLLRALGHALRAVGRFPEARSAYGKARRLFHHLGEDLDHAICALGLVDACMYLGRAREALEVAEGARRVFLRRRDAVRLARLECNVGNLFHRMDGLEQALVHYDRADRLIVRAGLDVDRARVAHNRANILTHLGRRAEAEELYRSAQKALEAAGEVVLAAQVRYGLACLRFLNGEYAAAITELEEVRPELARRGARPLLALADLDLAEVLLAMRLYPEALALARAAGRWFRRHAVPMDRARCDLVVGTCLARLGRSQDALRALASADRLFHRQGNRPGRAAVVLARARVAWLDGEHRETSRRALRAHNGFRRAGLLGRALAAGALAAEGMLAAGQHERARTMARTLLREPPYPGDAYSRARLARVEASAAAAEGDTAAALRSYRSALELTARAHSALFVDEWRVGFLGEEPPILEEYLGVLLQRCPPVRARDVWRWIARQRSAWSAPRGNDGPGPAVRMQVERLRGELEACYARLWRVQGGTRRMEPDAARRVERRALRLEGRMRRLAVQRSRVPSRVPTPRVPRVAAGEGRLYYFAVDGSLFALIQREDGWRLVPGLAPLEEIESLTRLFHYHLDVGTENPTDLSEHRELIRTRAQAQLAELARVTLEPAFVDRPPPRRLRIAPYGPLFRVPFHALPWRGAPLVASTEVSLDLGFGVERKGRTLHRAAWSIGFGEGMVEREALQVAALLRASGADVELQIGPEARVEALAKAARSAGHIHLCGHAVYRAQHPEFSALRLANGWASALDFAALPLEGASVVLSACETGPRGAVGGDEMLGLARGLTRAGARAVLATQWRVDDRAALGLITDLYDRWRSSDGLGRALQQAQTARALRGEPLEHWGAFCLVGDPGARWPAGKPGSRYH